MWQSFSSCNFRRWSHINTAIAPSSYPTNYDFSINNKFEINWLEWIAQQTMDHTQIQTAEAISDPNSSSLVYHLALDIGGNFHFFPLIFCFFVSSRVVNLTSLRNFLGLWKFSILIGCFSFWVVCSSNAYDVTLFLFCYLLMCRWLNWIELNLVCILLINNIQFMS